MREQLARPGQPEQLVQPALIARLEQHEQHELLGQLARLELPGPPEPLERPAQPERLALAFRKDQRRPERESDIRNELKIEVASFSTRAAYKTERHTRQRN